jgi:hypothetical protein
MKYQVPCDCKLQKKIIKLHLSTKLNIKLKLQQAKKQGLENFCIVDPQWFAIHVEHFPKVNSTIFIKRMNHKLQQWTTILL